MSNVDKGLYAASCNPPRRAKRPRLDSDDGKAKDALSSSAATLLALPSQPRPILPRRGHSTVPSNDSSYSVVLLPFAEPYSAQQQPVAAATTATAPNPPAKRGRKPGPLSRSAREAQRRLNHSIIEKARRTKINNALATLKELVPPDFTSNAQKGTENSKDKGGGTDNDEESDADGEYDVGKKPTKPNQPGKKEEKEKEYKLEILVRTVSFMQDLLKRVAVLEQTARVCSKCGSEGETTEQSVMSVPERSYTPDKSDKDNLDQRARKRSRSDTIFSRRSSSSCVDLPIPAHSSSSQNTALPIHRLPSISSWLPETLLDPSIYTSSAVSPSRIDPPRNKDNVPLTIQLLTPPSSTNFRPLQQPVPPSTSGSSLPTPPSSSSSALSLTPFSRPSTTNNTNTNMTLSPTRTPEDEHAASMLLQISCSGGGGSSPVFRPLPPSMFPLPSSTTSASVCAQPYHAIAHRQFEEPRPVDNAPDGTGLVSVRSRYAAEDFRRVVMQPETPGTMLGLIKSSRTNGRGMDL